MVTAGLELVDTDRHAWGAALRYQGKIVYIIHAGNGPSSSQ